MSIADEPLLILDGACGTNLQLMDLPPAVWNGCEGCNEALNIFSPEAVIELHRGMLAAGAMALETNTFGASSVVLGEYGLQDRVREINRAAVQHARAAIAELDRPGGGTVIGSVGPGTKLPSLGHISVEDSAASIAEQAAALIEAGVDALLVETCQDLLQTKTALVTIFEALEQGGRQLPVMASVTIEQQGTMLVGSDIAAVVATLEPFPLFSLGLNCATGPADMRSHLRYLVRNWPGRISCVPNQGLPEVVAGQTVYPLSPEQFAEQMHRFVTEEGVSVVGGCCGTSRGHIKALVKRLEGAVVARREVLS